MMVSKSQYRRLAEGRKLAKERNEKDPFAVDDLKRREKEKAVEAAMKPPPAGPARAPLCTVKGYKRWFSVEEYEIVMSRVQTIVRRGAGVQSVLMKVVKFVFSPIMRNPEVGLDRMDIPIIKKYTIKLYTTKTKKTVYGEQLMKIVRRTEKHGMVISADRLDDVLKHPLTDVLLKHFVRGPSEDHPELGTFGGINNSKIVSQFYRGNMVELNAVELRAAILADCAERWARDGRTDSRRRSVVNDKFFAELCSQWDPEKYGQEVTVVVPVSLKKRLETAKSSKDISWLVVEAVVAPGGDAGEQLNGSNGEATNSDDVKGSHTKKRVAKLVPMECTICEERIEGRAHVVPGCKKGLCHPRCLTAWLCGQAVDIICGCTEYRQRTFVDFTNVPIDSAPLSMSIEVTTSGTTFAKHYRLCVPIVLAKAPNAKERRKLARASKQHVAEEKEQVVRGEEMIQPPDECALVHEGPEEKHEDRCMRILLDAPSAVREEKEDLPVAPVVPPDKAPGFVLIGAPFGPGENPGDRVERFGPIVDRGSLEPVTSANKVLNVLPKPPKPMRVPSKTEMIGEYDGIRVAGSTQKWVEMEPPSCVEAAPKVPVLPPKPQAVVEHKDAGDVESQVSSLDDSSRGDDEKGACDGKVAAVEKLVGELVPLNRDIIDAALKAPIAKELEIAAGVIDRARNAPCVWDDLFDAGTMQWGYIQVNETSLLQRLRVWFKLRADENTMCRFFTTLFSVFDGSDGYIGPTNDLHSDMLAGKQSLFGKTVSVNGTTRVLAPGYTGVARMPYIKATYEQVLRLRASAVPTELLFRYILEDLCFRDSAWKNSTKYVLLLSTAIAVYQEVAITTQSFINKTVVPTKPELKCTIC